MGFKFMNGKPLFVNGNPSLCCCADGDCSYGFNASSTANRIYIQLDAKAVIHDGNRNTPTDPGYDPTNFTYDDAISFNVYFPGILDTSHTIRIWFSGPTDPDASASYDFATIGLDGICVNGVFYSTGTGSGLTPITLVDGVNFVLTVGYTDESGFGGGEVFNFSCGECP